MAKITVQNTNITIINKDGADYVSITDLARHKSDDPNAVIGNWMRNRNTIEFLGVWESLYNPDFNPLEFEGLDSMPLHSLQRSGLKRLMQ